MEKEPRKKLEAYLEGSLGGEEAAALRTELEADPPPSIIGELLGGEEIASREWSLTLRGCRLHDGPEGLRLLLPSGAATLRVRAEKRSLLEVPVRIEEGSIQMGEEGREALHRTATPGTRLDLRF